MSIVFTILPDTIGWTAVPAAKRFKRTLTLLTCVPKQLHHHVCSSTAKLMMMSLHIDAIFETKWCSVQVKRICWTRIAQMRQWVWGIAASQVCLRTTNMNYSWHISNWTANLMLHLNHNHQKFLQARQWQVMTWCICPCLQTVPELWSSFGTDIRAYKTVNCPSKWFYSNGISDASILPRTDHTEYMFTHIYWLLPAMSQGHAVSNANLLKDLLPNFNSHQFVHMLKQEYESYDGLLCGWRLLNVNAIVVWSSMNIVPTEDALSHLMENLDSHALQIHQIPAHFDLIHRLDNLPSLIADALGILGAAALYMHIHLPSALSYGGPYRPAIDVSFSDKPENRCKRIFKRQDTEGMQPHRCDMATYQLNNICEAYIRDHWPCQTKQETLNFLQNLYSHLESRIPQLGNFCVVCGLQQKQNGMKPVPCDSEACNFAFDELGLGASLTDIYSRPIIADLLISMASSACHCKSRRKNLFKCLPSDFLLTQKDNDDSDDSDDSKQDSKQIDWGRMEQAFQGLPSVATMSQKPNLQQYFLGKNPDSESDSEAEITLDVLLGGSETSEFKDGLVQFRLLRSILNSCRGHLMQIEESDQFSMMDTRYQFRLCTDSPAKEADFARKKVQYGSHYLFHGSAFHNWHCILREGLKDLTDSYMSTNGSTYGSGIYLADDSGRSSLYCCSSQGPYRNGVFGNLARCVALCEVLKTNYSTEPYDEERGIRVVRDPADVITRYLFVYTDTRIPYVVASKVGDICERHAKTQADSLQTFVQLQVSEQPAAECLPDPAPGASPPLLGGDVMQLTIPDLQSATLSLQARRNAQPAKPTSVETVKIVKIEQCGDNNFPEDSKDRSKADVFQYGQCHSNLESCRKQAICEQPGPGVPSGI